MSRYYLFYFILECKKINFNQREILENVIIGNETEHKPKHSLQINPKIHQFSIKSNTDQGKGNPLGLDRKYSEQKFSSNTQPKNSIEPKKKVCICYSTNKDVNIKNNICSLCNRYVEGSNDSSIKKRIVQSGDMNKDRPR